MLKLVTAALLVLGAIPALAQPNTIEAILALDERRMQAMVDANTEVLRRMLGEDLTYAHSNGIVQTKAQIIEALVKGGFDYKSIEVEEAHARVFGKSAVITGAAKFVVVAREQEVKTRLRYTVVYVERDGQWQMVAYQSTRLPAGP